MSILIIDDSIIHRKVLEHFLKQGGFDDIILTESARKAFEYLKPNAPGNPTSVDLILMDVQMPEMSGIEMCRLIKDSEELRDIPIVMVTGMTDMRSLKSAFAVGATDYIQKPVQEIELVTRVRASLRLKQEMDMRKARERELIEANKQIYLEKRKSEKLLLNILPSRVAEHLKEYGVAEPESFDDVTIYFSDVIEFTKLSSRLEPKVLIDELNDIFTAFDNIMESNKCERIKTIGDAYLAVCGMPTKNQDHAENIVISASQIIEYLESRNKKSEIKWEIRVGIHSGKVVGGVVGVKKYIYDVFGDTINTASRMESNSEPMRINISQTTYNLVQDKFSFIERDALEVKGKGLMKMFFLDR